MEDSFFDLGGVRMITAGKAEIIQVGQPDNLATAVLFQ